MTILENRTMEIICANLPRIASNTNRIASELKRIADAFGCQTTLKEGLSKIYIDGKAFNVAYKPNKENDNDEATAD